LLVPAAPNGRRAPMPRPHPARMRGHAPACITSLHEVPGSRLLCSGVAWRTSAAARATRGAAAAWSGTRTTGTRTLPRRHTRPQAARAKRGRGRRTRRTPPGRPTRSPGRRQGRLQSAGQRPQAHPSRSRASRTSRPCAPGTGPPSSATSAACVRRGCQQPRPAAGWPPGLQPDDILALDWSSALAAGEGMFESATHPLLCVYGTKSGRNAMERSSLPEVEATLLSGTASAGRRCAAASSRLPTSAASCR